MTISPKNVKFDEYNMWVELSDARTLGVPVGMVSQIDARQP
nr:Uncharacterised protein [Salmonella sp. NCTC 7297]